MKLPLRRESGGDATMNEKWNGEEWVLFSEALEESASGLMRPDEAERTLNKLCAKGDVRAVCFFPDGPKFIAPKEWSKGLDTELVYLSVDDLLRWVYRPGKPETGKQPRIKAHLAKMFPNGVPDPAHCPRKTLKTDLLKRDPSLNPLDEATLKSAIDAYNSDPKRSDRPHSD
jgi:hypothetical protein